MNGPGVAPVFYMLLGFLLQVLGVVVFLAGSDPFSGSEWLIVAGALVSSIGVLTMGIGLVAQGVRLGTRWADFDRWQARAVRQPQPIMQQAPRRAHGAPPPPYSAT